MKKIRFIAAIALSLFFTFTNFVSVAASAVDDNLALYVYNNLVINYGQVVVYGDAVAVDSVSGLGWDERVLDGKLYANVPEEQKNYSTEKYLATEPYGKPAPQINVQLKDFPELEKKGILSPANTASINQSGWYDEINVANNGQPGLTINANEGEVIEIRVDKLTLNSQINVTGSGTVLFYISQLSISGNNNPSINKNGTATVGLYLANNDNIVMNNITGNFSIYTNQSNITFKGDSRITGNLYMNGKLIIQDSSKITGYVGGNNLDAELSGGYPETINNIQRNVVIDGRLVANNVTMMYGPVVKLGSGITDINDGLAKAFAPSDSSELPELPVTEYENGILGEYFDAPQVTNQSALRKMQIDSRPFFNWQYGSPDESVIEVNTFAVRWTGFLKPEKSAYYTFKTLSDDGVRLYIDGNKLIDRWELIDLEYTASEPIYLEAGVYYPLVLEYQQQPLNSLIYLFWETDEDGMSSIPASVFYVTNKVKEEYSSAKYFNPVSGSGTGLTNKFYADEKDFTKEKKESYSEVNFINYEWGLDAPGDISNDTFFARMEGFIEPKYTEELTLSFEVDDAIKVWVDGELIIDQWNANSRETVSGTFSAVVGKKNRIKIEYSDFHGGATCIMRWQSELQEVEIVPAKYLYSE